MTVKDISELSFVEACEIAISMETGLHQSNQMAKDTSSKGTISKVQVYSPSRRKMDLMKFVLIVTSMFIHQATPETTEHPTMTASCSQQVELFGKKIIGLPVSPYENYMRCEYAIRSAPNTFIELEFTKMKVEDSPQCSADRIIVFDGEDSSSPLVGTYCGNKIPKLFTSSGSQLFIAFQSNGKNVDEGFEIKLTPIHDDFQSSRPRTEIYADEDKFTKAGGGLIYSHREYPNSTALAPGVYSLDISLKYGYNQVYIAFLDVALSEEPKSGVVPICNTRHENIEIFDRDGNLLDIICNGDSGSAIVTGDSMKLAMHITNVDQQEKGFLAIYALFYVTEINGTCLNQDDYLCKNWRCIPRYLTEDEHDHCGDGSDLPEPESKAGDGKCQYKDDLTNDKNDDCDVGSDLREPESQGM
ncbi:blastula protease 10-like isoform X2 [Ptychodera flava]|uniref:blastula protease 10-like isoform X2 n=1 Tax=Ptychodera flava TaxID=63121 RepID=UPI00396A967E